MKMKILIMLLTVLMTTSIALAESEAVKGARKDFESFKKEMSIKMDDIDKQLNELRVKAGAKGGEVREKSIKELEDQRAKLKSELDSLNEDAKSNWKKLKKKLAASVDSLHAKAKKALQD